MKPRSVHVSARSYHELKSLSARSGRPVAELIREAMVDYLERARASTRSVLDVAPHHGGKLLRRWTRSEILDEMIER